MPNARDLERPSSTFISTDSAIPSFVSVSSTMDGKTEGDMYPVTRSSRRPNPSEDLSVDVGGMRHGLSLVKDLGTGRSWPAGLSIQKSLVASRPGLIPVGCREGNNPPKGVPIASERSVQPCNAVLYNAQAPVVPIHHKPSPMAHRPAYIPYDPRPVPVATHGRVFTQVSSSNLSLIPQPRKQID